MVPSIDICLKHHTQYTGAAAAMSSPLTALSRNGVFDIVEQAAIRVCRASVFNVEGAVPRLLAAVKELTICEISCELSYPGEHVSAPENTFHLSQLPYSQLGKLRRNIDTDTRTRCVTLCKSTSVHIIGLSEHISYVCSEHRSNTHDYTRECGVLTTSIQTRASSSRLRRARSAPTRGRRPRRAIASSRPGSRAARQGAPA